MICPKFKMMARINKISAKRKYSTHLSFIKTLFSRQYMLLGKVWLFLCYSFVTSIFFLFLKCYSMHVKQSLNFFMNYICPYLPKNSTKAIVSQPSRIVLLVKRQFFFFGFCDIIKYPPQTTLGAGIFLFI